MTTSVIHWDGARLSATTTRRTGTTSPRTSIAPIWISPASRSSPTSSTGSDFLSEMRGPFLPGTPTRNFGPRATLLERVSDPQQSALGCDFGQERAPRPVAGVQGRIPDPREDELSRLQLSGTHATHRT